MTENLRQLVLEMMLLEFPRSTILGILRTAIQNAEDFLSSIEDEIRVRAIVKLA